MGRRHLQGLPTAPLHIDTTLPRSPEHTWKRPGSLNLRTTINANIAQPLPSALSTARQIEDINCITYPHCIKSPKLELNVNAQKGKFWYDLEIPEQSVALMADGEGRRACVGNGYTV